MARRTAGSVGAVAGGAVLVGLAWHPGSANPAVPAERAGFVGTAILLAVLPWVLRPLLGPVAEHQAARLVRAGGYLAVYGLLAVVALMSRFAGRRFDHFQAFDQANWEADMRAGAWVSVALMAGLVGVYAVIVLAATARRTAAPRAVLAEGSALGAAAAVLLYALMPLGNLRHLPNGGLQFAYDVLIIAVPIVALVRAGRVAGIRGGLWAGAAAALLLTVLTIGTMLAFPGHVDLEWANPSPLVPHGTPYEVQMSVGDAAIKYYAVLLFGPLAGLVIGGATTSRRLA